MIKRLLLAVFLAPMLSVGILTFAQDNVISYGSFTTEALDATTPARFYTFDATAGDLITLEVVPLSQSLDPDVSLLGANNTVLAASTDDPFQPGSQNARLGYRLADTGAYTVIVAAEDNSNGQFLLRLELRTPLLSSTLSATGTTSANLTVANPVQAFSLDSAQAQTLSLRSDVPDFPFVAELRTATGQTLSILTGSGVRDLSFSLAPETGVYELVLSPAQSGEEGTVLLDFGATEATSLAAVAPATATPASTPTAESDSPVATEPTEASPEETAAADAGDGLPTDRCVVVAAPGGVIIRQFPSTDAAPISSIAGNDFRYADGTDGVWYRLIGGGWVSSGVVDTNGLCEGLPTVAGTGASASGSAPAQPVATPVPDTAPVGARGG